jgi:hypothetical protein
MKIQMVGRPQAGARQGAFVGVQLGGLKHPHHSNHACQTQSVRQSLPPPIATAQQARSVQLSKRAGGIAAEQALIETKRALNAVAPAERQELRQNAAILKAWSKRLQTEARHAR